MNIVKEAAASRDAVKRAGKPGPGKRYPAELRRRGAAYLSARKAAGAPLSAVLRELGVRRETLSGWSAPQEIAEGRASSRSPLWRRRPGASWFTVQVASASTGST
jgi:hypothetical protein